LPTGNASFIKLAKSIIPLEENLDLSYIFQQALIAQFGRAIDL
jgi:hypothetical protein|tara:strand:+ start:514 stop:642 length:129 start_codon:yes stop_codon:yes gene_type:complete